MTDQLAVLPEPDMSFGLFLATEGGRKCPQCGRYAKRDELGFIGGRYKNANGGITCVTAYGHKDGFGCNADAKSRAAAKGGG